MPNYALILTMLCSSFYSPVVATEFFVDTFDDGAHDDQVPVLWSPGGASSGNRIVEDGRLVHKSENRANMSTYVDECFGDTDCYFNDVSLRTSFTIEGPPIYVTLFARSAGDPNATLYGGTDASGNALLAMSVGSAVRFLGRESTDIEIGVQEVSMRFDVQDDEMAFWIWPTGETVPESPNVTASIPDSYPRDDGTVGFFYNPGSSGEVSFDYFAAVATDHQDVVGDFDFDGQLGVSDVDSLSSHIRLGYASVFFDVNSDGMVNQLDRDHWVSEIKQTWLGDANLDGEFTSADIVQVLQSGHYEDGVEANSTWATGDWNGDADFSSADFVATFEEGGYEKGPRVIVNLVPEPSSQAWALVSLLFVTVRRKR